MKQLKIWSMMMLIAMTPPMLTACGGGDDGDDKGSIDINELIGNWYCLENTIISSEYQIDNWYKGAIINVRTNGTITSTTPDFDMLGRYSISNNSIVITPEHGRMHYFRVSINGDRMTWNESSENHTATYVFERAEIAVIREITPYGTWTCTGSFTNPFGKRTSLVEGDEVVIKIDGTYTSTSSSFGTKGTFDINLYQHSIIALSNTGETFNLRFMELSENYMVLRCLYDNYYSDYSFSRKAQGG